MRDKSVIKVTWGFYGAEKSPAMRSLPSILSPLPLPLAIPLNRTGHLPLHYLPSVGFLRSSPLSRARHKAPTPLLPDDSQLSDADEDDEDDEDDEEFAADEYDDVSGDAYDGAEQSEDEIEASADDAAASTRATFRESKLQRVEKLCSEVREFGTELIDVDELASVYDFRIDKFQVHIFN